jgi:chemotaxis protein MotB
MDSETQPIIIKKKVARHGGHHGGAWKVAYADFVTAMMALFIVLWLLNTSDDVKQAISGYFQSGTGKAKISGSGLAGSGEGVAVGKQDMNKLKEKIEDAVRALPKFDQLKDNLDVTVTGEGLRLELLESERGMFFEKGNASPTEEGNELLAKLAQELAKLPNTIVIEGHTDARPFSTSKAYTNWELSTDRANAARRLMQANGVRPDQIKQVRGYADQHLRDRQDPDDATNRRVTVIVQYQPPPLPGEGDSKAGEHGSAANETKPKHGA